MAEIHVETKKHSAAGSTWIWIVVILLIAAAVIYYLVNRNKNGGTTAPPANTTSFLYSMPASANAAIPASTATYRG